MKVGHFIALGLIIAGVYGTAKFCLKKTNKFAVTEIRSNRPFEPSFETRLLTVEEEKEVKEALNQHYTYFGCGGQAFVFFSQNGKYVIKFFKQRHFNPPTYLDHIPFIEKYRKEKYGKRHKRLHLDYGSYKIGFEELKEETGLLYVHLNKTSHLKKILKIKDKLNIEHCIDLDQIDFILQKRADLVFHRIKAQMARNDIEGAQKTIACVLDLIVTRCKKGYTDKDPNIATNCGMLENKAIKVDVGRFTRYSNMANPLYFKPELYHLTKPFRVWLKQQHPSLVPFLDKEVIRIIAHE